MSASERTELLGSDARVGAAARSALNVYTIGLALVIALTGVIGVQYGTYRYSYKHDPPWLRVLAGLVALVSAGELVGDIMVLNQVALLGLSNPIRLIAPPSNAGIAVAMTIVASVLVQSYFAFTIYRLLSNSKIWLSAIVILLIAELAIGTSSALFLHLGASSGSLLWASLAQTYAFPVYITWISLTAIIDTTSSSVLCRHLWLARRSSRFQQTHDILGRTLVSTLECFSLTAVVSIVALLCSLAPLALEETNPSLPAWRLTAATLSTHLLGRLYPISFFYSLNRRSLPQARKMTESGIALRSAFGASRPTSSYRHSGVEETRPSTNSRWSGMPPSSYQRFLPDPPRPARLDSTASKAVYVNTTVAIAVDVDGDAATPLVRERIESGRAS